MAFSRLSAVVNTFLNFAEAFCVGSPENNDFFDFVQQLEVADVLTDLLQLVLLGLAKTGNVISAIALIRSDEVILVQTGKGLHLLHEGVELFD